MGLDPRREQQQHADRGHGELDTEVPDARDADQFGDRGVGESPRTQHLVGNADREGAAGRQHAGHGAVRLNQYGRLPEPEPGQGRQVHQPVGGAVEELRHHQPHDLGDGQAPENRPHQAVARELWHGEPEGGHDDRDRDEHPDRLAPREAPLGAYLAGGVGHRRRISAGPAEGRSREGEPTLGDAAGCPAGVPGVTARIERPGSNGRDRRSMSRRPPYAGAGARTQQTGMVLALAYVPTTFQRTLMPRSTLDQALTTGICSALHYGFASLIQDTVEAVALRVSGATSAEQVDAQTWRRASIAADLAAIAFGLAGQAAYRLRPGERIARGAVRTICWWVSVTGLCGALAGVLQELTGRENGTDDDSIPVALAAGMLLAGVNDYRRRRSEAADAGSRGGEDAGVSAFKSLVMSLGVSAGLRAMAVGEQAFATAVSRMLARVLSGSELLYRPVGHAAALSVAGMAIYDIIRRADHQAEHSADVVERAFATAPRSSMVSGGAGSLVSWDSLSREGRRNVSTALGTQMIERVMGEPAA